MSSGRLFQSFGPTEPNERSPTVTRRDGRTSSWLEVADHRRQRDGKSATRRRKSDRYRGAVPCRDRYTRTASLKLMRSGARSQWKLARVAMWHDCDIDFARLLHPAMWHVALESWQWIHQVAAPYNVIHGSGMTVHFNIDLSKYSDHNRICT